jgi:hypothetical protein
MSGVRPLVHGQEALLHRKNSLLELHALGWAIGHGLFVLACEAENLSFPSP